MKRFNIPHLYWEEYEGKRVWVITDDGLEFVPQYFIHCCVAFISEYYEIGFKANTGLVISPFITLAVFDSYQKAKLALRILEKYPELSLGETMKKCSKIYRRRHHE